ncbi:MAG: hypothetical protein R3Y13_04985 [bacterium]
MEKFKNVVGNYNLPQRLNGENSRKILKKLRKLDFPNEFISHVATDDEFKNVVEVTKDKFISLFGEFDRNVNFINKKKYIEINKELRKLVKRNLFEKEYEKLAKNKSEVTDLFEIPILPSEEKFDTSVYSRTFSKNTYFVNGVILSKENLSTLSSCYAHECTHVLTERNKRTVSDELDREFLSIFLEKIFIKEDSEEFKISELNRWVDINPVNLETFTNEEKFVLHTYYNANVLAVYLYYIYRNMKEPSRLKLLKDIRKVFTGNFTTKEFMNKYNLNFKNDDVVTVVLDAAKESKKYHLTR